MGLLNKLFGGKASADEALNVIKNTARNLLNEAEKAAYSAQSSTASAPQAPAQPAPAAPAETTPAGCSWGPTVPAEPCQYNYNGSYGDYFTEVFTQDFPEYRVEKEPAPNADRMTFTFFDGERKALVVEILSQSSSVYKNRRECAKLGIPYLRFYHDHWGWWNTRSYVTDRVRNALGGR